MARLANLRQTLWFKSPLYKAYLYIPLDPLSDPIRKVRLYPFSDEKTGLQSEIR